MPRLAVSGAPLDKGNTGVPYALPDSMFGRIKNLLTPPPGKASDPGIEETPQPDAREEEAQFNQQLRNSLETLIGAPGLQSTEAVEAVAALKALAKARGPYVTAARIRMQLQARRAESQDSEDVGRGYVLAGDFILQHMVREIESIEHKSVGPNIFKAYCNDLVDCLSRGRKVRRCIEIPVMTMDSLLARALNSGRYKNVYIEMARQVVLATEEVVSQRVERDERSTRQMARESRAANTPVPSKPDPATTLDRATTKFLLDLIESIDKIRDGLARYEAVPALSEQAAASGEFDRPRMEAHGAYLNGLLPIAAAAGYHPFTAMVKGRMGTLLSHVDAANGNRFRVEAAQTYEAQGELERGLHFRKLAEVRYRAASEHYRRAGESERASAVLEKSAALGSDA